MLAVVSRHPFLSMVCFLALIGLMLTFRPVTNVILDVVGNVILYVVLLGGTFLAVRALVRFGRKHRRGVPAR
jgi:ascorbate-specific PTS system EIIC-type component UlaA